MKTVLIERGIVVFDEASGARIVASKSSVSMGMATPSASTQSEAEFYDRFQAGSPALVVDLKIFLSSLGTVGVSVDFRRSAVLRFYINVDVPASAGFIDAAGQVWFNDAWGAALKCGRSGAAQKYLDKVAAAVGGRVSAATPTKTANVVEQNGKVMTAIKLLPVSEAWRDAIAVFIVDLTIAEQN